MTEQKPVLQKVGRAKTQMVFLDGEPIGRVVRVTICPIAGEGAYAIISQAKVEDKPSHDSTDDTGVVIPQKLPKRIERKNTPVLVSLGDGTEDVFDPVYEKLEGPPSQVTSDQNVHIFMDGKRIDRVGRIAVFVTPSGIPTFTLSRNRGRRVDEEISRTFDSMLVAVGDRVDEAAKVVSELFGGEKQS